MGDDEFSEYEAAADEFSQYEPKDEFSQFEAPVEPVPFLGATAKKARRHLGDMALQAAVEGAGADLYEPEANAYEKAREAGRKPMIPLYSGAGDDSGLDPQSQDWRTKVARGGLKSVMGVPAPGERADPRAALAHGVLATAEGLTSPENVAILLAMGALPEKLSVLARVLKTGVEAYFAYDMGRGTIQNVEKAIELYQAGDTFGAQVAVTQAGLMAPMALASAVGAKRTVFKPLDDRIAAARAAGAPAEAPSPMPAEPAQAQPPPVMDPTSGALLEDLQEAEVASRTPDQRREIDANIMGGPRSVPGPAEEAVAKASVDEARARAAAALSPVGEAPADLAARRARAEAEAAEVEARRAAAPPVEEPPELPTEPAAAEPEFVEVVVKGQKLKIPAKLKRAEVGEGTGLPVSERLAYDKLPPTDPEAFRQTLENTELVRPEGERPLEAATAEEPPPFAGPDRRMAQEALPPEGERRTYAEEPTDAERYIAKLEASLKEPSITKAQRESLEGALSEAQRKAVTPDPATFFKPNVNETAQLAGLVKSGVPLLEAAERLQVPSRKAKVFDQLNRWIEDMVVSKGTVGRFQNPESLKWGGAKSQLPKELQATDDWKVTLELRAGMLRNGLKGFKLRGKSKEFYEKAVALAWEGSVRDAPGDPFERMANWVEAHQGSIPKEDYAVLKEAIGAQAPTSPMNPDYVEAAGEWFGEQAAQERAAMGAKVPEAGISNEFYQMDDGTTVQKMNPPAPVLSEMVNSLLPGNEGTAAGFQRSVDSTLKPLYSVEAPVKVVMTTERVSSSVQLEDGSFEIRMPEISSQYQLLHEFFEIRKKLGEEIDIPHDNNAIADRFIQDAIGPRWAEERPSVLQEMFPDRWETFQRMRDALEDTLTPEERQALDTFGANAAGPLEVYGKRFYDLDVKPTLEKVGAVATDWWKRFFNVLMPDRGASARFLDDFGTARGTEMKELEHLMLNAADRGWLTAWGRMGREETIANIEAFEAGIPMLNDKLRKTEFKEFTRALSDKIFEKLRGRGLDIDYRENWLSHIWTAESIGLLKRENPGLYASLLGGEWWKNSRIHERFKQGIDAGLEPITWNGFELWKRGITAEWRHATGLQAFEGMEKNGTALFVPKGHRPPEDWRENDLDARLKWKRGELLGQETLPGMEGVPGEAEGKWYIEPNAYRVVKNWLSRDVLRQAKGVSWLMRMVNLDKAITLAVPLFHTTAETFHAFGADILYGGKGIFEEGRKFAYGNKDFDPAKLVGHIAELGRGLSVVGPSIQRVRLGQKVKDYIRNPEKFKEIHKDFLAKHPEFIHDMELLYDGGLHVGSMQPYYKGFVDAVARSFEDHNPTGAILRGIVGAVPATASLISHPVFGHYIPKLKAGVALFELNRARMAAIEDLSSGKLSERTLARRVVQSVENRFGEVEFDNWYWHRVTRSVLSMLMLSPSWAGGDLKLAGVGATSQIRELKQALWNDPVAYMEKIGKTGPKAYLGGVRAPKMTYEMEALVGVLLAGAYTSTLAQKILSGKWPGETGDDGKSTLVKDLVYPRAGGLDENGHPIRLALPGYGPAYYVWLTHAGQHLINAAAPMPKRFIETMVNKKSYTGEEVRNPLDPPFKKAVDSIAYAAFGPWPGIGEGPFWQQQITRLKETGAKPGAIVLGVMGGRHAGKYVDETDGEEAIRTIHQRRLPSSRTAEAVQKSQEIRNQQEALRNGADPADVMAALTTMSESQRRSVIQSMKKTQYQVWFGSQGIKDALEAWPHLSKTEKKVFQKALRDKFMRAKAQHFPSFGPTEIPSLVERMQAALGEPLTAE